MTAKSNFLQSEINGAIKAAAAAGYNVRMVKHPDGRLEINAQFAAGSPVEPAADPDGLSAFEKWERGNAR